MSTNQQEVILRARQVTKIFPGTVALNKVDFNVYKGKVNVLVGENGAGKSTLTKILAGVETPTEGKLLLDGEEVRIRSFHDAVKHGIGMIHQELNLFPNMDVSENIFVAHELTKAGGFIDHKSQVEKTKELMERLQADIDPKAQVGDLRIGQQQIVEIAKALALETNILIMDEPTSALSTAEVEILFKIIEDLKAHGVSIIYISHRLEELTRIGDYISVLRDGNMVDERPMTDVDVPWIVASMVGDAADQELAHVSHSTGEQALRVEDLSLPREGGGYTVDHVNLTLNKGEILGIYGLMGAGRSEFFECLMGLHDEACGHVFLEDTELCSCSVDDHLKKGMALIPEDRQREGLVQALSVSENMTLSSLWKFTKVFQLMGDRIKEAVSGMIKDMSIKVASPNVLISSLSGGNQQKVVIGKALLTSPKVLLMDEPTRGIDVGAKGEVFEIMNDLASKGLGILFVTSELKEIMAISDRIVVMSEGRITGEFDRKDATEEALVAASAVGHATAEQEPIQ